LTSAEQQGAAYRVGFGYDAHRLTHGRKLILGGVEIPSEKGLDGHSDADVLLHAICDALLGAAALGDIGTHFPNSDPHYRGISSVTLLSRVSSLLVDRGYRTINVDATLVLERPKIAPYVSAMREIIASALAIPPDAVSIKATTNEGLGAVGAGEGAVAHAVALLVQTSRDVHHEQSAR
jgi:2-C-methyl-D-erythritol 2,4-cyclodiphosphate synthase